MQAVRSQSFSLFRIAMAMSYEESDLCNLLTLQFPQPFGPTCPTLFLELWRGNTLVLCGARHSVVTYSQNADQLQILLLTTAHCQKRHL